MVSNRALSRTTDNELQLLVPIALIVILLAAALLTRSLFSPLALLILIVFTVGSTMGVAGWSGIVLTPISAYIPIIVMAVTVAYSIHIITGTFTRMRSGASKIDAITGSIDANMYPIFLTSVTTVVGFASLNFSNLPPFRTLGTFVAIGVIFNFVFSMTLLPTLLSFLPLKAPKGAESRSNRYLQLADFVIGRRRLLMWSMAAIAILCMAGVFRIELSDNFVKYYGERHEFRQNMEFVINNFTGLDTQEYSLDSGKEGGITDPAYLNKIDDFAQWYRAQPGVHHIWVFSDIIKRLNRNLNNNNPEFYRIPSDGEVAVQYLLLYELSLPQGRDLNNSINVSKSATRMVVTHRNLTSREQRRLAERGADWLATNAPGLAAQPAAR